MDVLGNIIIRKITNLFGYCCKTQNAVKVLKEIIPFLLNKRKQAELGLKYMKEHEKFAFICGRNGFPKSLINFQNKTYERFRTMKRKGNERNYYGRKI